MTLRFVLFPLSFARVLRLAGLMRARHLKRIPASLKEVYSACYFLAKLLRPFMPDVTIMVGDVDGIMHHWIESRSRNLYIDPAAPEGVLVGNIEDAGYGRYQKGQAAGFDLGDPRNHPRYVYAPETGESPYY